MKDYESLINYPEIEGYLRGLVKNSDRLSALYELCRSEDLPTVKPETAQFLKFIYTVLKPKKILEIGTCVGYSALLAEEYTDAFVVTVDRYEYMIERAEKNFAEYGKGRITLLKGQATEILKGMQDGFDFIFLDAAKGQYPVFLPHLKRLLKKGGILCADNVLERGIVASPERAQRRDRTIAKRLNEFLKEISSDEDFETTVLPLGDGVSLSYKK